MRRSLSAHRGHDHDDHHREYSEALARVATLEVELSLLQDRLSREQQSNWELGRRGEDARRLHHDIQTLQNERNHNLQQIKDLEDDWEEEHRKYEEMKEKYKMLKRNSSQEVQRFDNYQIRYEEKCLRLNEKSQEVEVLRQRLRERDELILYNEGKIAQKDQSLREKRKFIDYLTSFLRNLGYSVVDERVIGHR